ncbi:5'-nucleotidase SurE [Alsobacter metallidurans]|uniref:5'-nucleotidase SurE n=1 Tax=Alsobacter metallidurans TaxID=340221 RepID=A0A917I943_9HYPH|nr:5'/3'-nucleotidase SurE [Alsobacter metallidurans]GGH21973.1 5'-nucleotidase SurE [Alsobacter metallidurans]
MRILVTNDDGIHGPGLTVCEAIAHALSDDVWTVAPETDQSGVAHSLTLSDPLRLRQIDEKRFAVKGTPTDCVIMGVRHILKDKRPDLVLSGVNKGQNVAEDVTYSGTVAGAIEATILGIPAIALSQAYGPAGRDAINWKAAELHAPGVIRKVLEAGIPSGVLVNVNFPNCEPGTELSAVVGAQGWRSQEFLRIEERADGRGLPYFWIGFVRGKYPIEQGSDLHALANGRISVTPLRIDLTDEPTLTRYAQVFGG